MIQQNLTTVFTKTGLIDAFVPMLFLFVSNDGWTSGIDGQRPEALDRYNTYLSLELMYGSSSCVSSSTVMHRSIL